MVCQQDHLLQRLLGKSIFLNKFSNELIVTINNSFRTRTDEELEYLPNEPFRKDLLRFGWEKNSMSATKLRFLYLFPQRLQWVGNLFFGTLFDNKSLLKLDTKHLENVGRN